ncbi:PD-(D/E)XK nuclease family protein [Candidatus Woesearchaeota archaeon]|nr:PD-(D/E)XK nuclease family protein [Candidatus Woesearchaeota archaeon]
MTTFSHSRISSFEQCKLKYKYHYIDKVETEIVRTIETFMGDIVHQTLEKLYKDLKFQKLNELQELIEFYNNLWIKNWEDGILIVKEQYTAENYKIMGQKMIEDYYKHYQPFNQAKTIGLETEDYYELNDKYKIHVRIDRLSSPEPGVYEIHDYKTNSNMKTQEEADSDRQLAVYAMGVKKLYPDAKKIKLIWHMLAFDREVVSERTNEQLDQLKKEIIEEIELMLKEINFEPTKSALCNYCEYQSICPLWKHLFEQKKEEIAEETLNGKDLADNYARLKQYEKKVQKKMDEISEKIKRYSEKNNCRVLFGTNNALTIWSKESIKFPGKNDELRNQFKEALKGLNLYEKYLEIDNWVLEKDYPKLSDIDKSVLEKFGKKQTIFRLYLKERDV